MPPNISAAAIRVARALLFVLFINGCGGSYEETVTGVTVPIPSGMKKSQGKTVEISLPGFGGGYIGGSPRTS